MSRYILEFRDAYTGSRMSQNPEEYETLDDALKSAGDLVSDNVADDVVVRDLRTMEMEAYQHALGLPLIYMNFEEVARIRARKE